MSIILGKRHVYENTFDDLSATFQNQANISFKRVRGYDGSSGNASPNPELKKNYSCNLNYLKTVHPNIKESELLNFLELCDNNLNLVLELIGKAQNMSNKDHSAKPQIKNDITSIETDEQIGSHSPSMDDNKSDKLVDQNQQEYQNRGERQVKKILSLKPQRQIPTENTQQVSANAENNQIFNDVNLNTLINRYSTLLLPSLQKASNLQEAQAQINQCLRLFADEIKKESRQNMQKYLDQNTLLKKAFIKLNQKTKVLTETNEQLRQNVQVYEEEIQKERMLNYKLELRIKQIGTGEEDRRGYDVY